MYQIEVPKGKITGETLSLSIWRRCGFSGIDAGQICDILLILITFKKIFSSSTPGNE